MEYKTGDCDQLIGMFRGTECMIGGRGVRGSKLILGKGWAVKSERRRSEQQQEQALFGLLCRTDGLAKRTALRVHHSTLARTPPPSFLLESLRAANVFDSNHQMLDHSTGLPYNNSTLLLCTARCDVMASRQTRHPRHMFAHGD